MVPVVHRRAGPRTWTPEINKKIRDHPFFWGVNLFSIWVCGNSNIFGFFIPIFREDEPILTSIFFKGVGSTTNSLYFWGSTNFWNKSTEGNVLEGPTWKTHSKQGPSTPFQMTLMTQEMSSARVGSSSNQTLDSHSDSVSGPIFSAPPFGLFESSLEMILDYPISPPFPQSHPWIVKVSILGFSKSYIIGWNGFGHWDSKSKGFWCPKTSMCSSHRQLDPFIDVFSPFSFGGP